MNELYYNVPPVEEPRNVIPPTAQRPTLAVRGHLYSPIPHDAHPLLTHLRYEIETKLTVYKDVACIPSHSVRYSPF